MMDRWEPLSAIREAGMMADMAGAPRKQLDWVVYVPALASATLWLALGVAAGRSARLDGAAVVDTRRAFAWLVMGLLIGTVAAIGWGAGAEEHFTGIPANRARSQTSWALANGRRWGARAWLGVFILADALGLVMLAAWANRGRGSLEFLGLVKIYLMFVAWLVCCMLTARRLRRLGVGAAIVLTLLTACLVLCFPIVLRPMQVTAAPTYRLLTAASPVQELREIFRAAMPSADFGVPPGVAAPGHAQGWQLPSIYAAFAFLLQLYSVRSAKS